MERSSEEAGPAALRRDAELFVHLRLETGRARPWLADPDVAQAAEMALGACARLYRCRVLALGSGPDHLHAVLRFPASQPLNELVRRMQQRAGEAAARALAYAGRSEVRPEAVWSRRYRLDTLSAGDVAGLVDYVCRHPQVHAQGPLRPEYEHPAGGLGADERGSYVVRERRRRYPAP